MVGYSTAHTGSIWICICENKKQDLHVRLPDFDPLEFFFHLRKNNKFDLSLKLCISDQPDLNRINLVQFYQFQYLIKLIGHMLIGPNLNRLDDLMFGKLLDNIFYILATKNEHQVLVDLLASSK